MIEVIVKKFEIEAKSVDSNDPKEPKSVPQVTLEFTLCGLGPKDGIKTGSRFGEKDHDQVLIDVLNECLGYVAVGGMVTAGSSESGNYNVMITKDGKEFRENYEFKRIIDIPDAVLQAYFKAVGSAEETEVKVNLASM